MNPPLRIDPLQLNALATRFEAAVPGLDAARDTLRAAAGDPALATGRALAPATWAAASSAVDRALDEVEHVRRVVAGTPGLLRSCAEQYATGDRLAADLMQALDTHQPDPVPPLTLSDLAPPPAALPPPPALSAAESPGAASGGTFRLPHHPATLIAGEVAGVRPSLARRPGPTGSGMRAATGSAAGGGGAGDAVPPVAGPPARHSVIRRTGTRGDAGGATASGASGGSGGSGGVPGSGALPPVGDVRREDILQRAKRWADLGLDYSMSRTFEGYRMDCSGLVSMAWGLPAPGLTTDTMEQVAHRIDKDELLPGDVLVNTAPGAAGHTLIFAGWADETHTRYFAYEESGGKGAHFGTVPYPYWPGHGTFRPYRLDSLRD